MAEGSYTTETEYLKSRSGFKTLCRRMKQCGAPTTVELFRNSTVQKKAVAHSPPHCHQNTLLCAPTNRDLPPSVLLGKRSFETKLEKNFTVLHFQLNKHSHVIIFLSHSFPHTMGCEVKTRCRLCPRHRTGRWFRWRSDAQESNASMTKSYLSLCTFLIELFDQF